MLAYVLDTRQVVPGTLADFLRDDPRPIEELFFLTDSEETKLDLQRTLSALPGIAFADPFPRDLEVMAGGIDKGEGLRFLLDRLGVAPDQAMALGDGGSDLPMLRLAGVGVAMGSATQAVKDGADWVTSSCDENGVARAIEKAGHSLFSPSGTVPAQPEAGQKQQALSQPDGHGSPSPSATV